jgi:hypothetical protein
MNLTDIQSRLLGAWTGNNLLRLSWLTPSDFHSPSNLTVAAAAQGACLTFSYTWSHEEKAHAGLLLLGHDDKLNLATAAWVDSWHQRAGLLNCQGAIDAAGAIDVRGSYAAPPGPDWGWRIVITPGAADTLQLAMYNITPEGDEDLAVRADYRRAD